MLTRKDTPDGPVWMRTKFSESAYSPSRRDIERIEEWRDAMPFENLLEERGGPFLGSFIVQRRFERDGAQWARMRAFVLDYGIDVEIRPDGWIGRVVPVPAAEAWRMALERDKHAKERIEIEPD